MAMEHGYMRANANGTHFQMQVTGKNHTSTAVGLMENVAIPEGLLWSTPAAVPGGCLKGTRFSVSRILQVFFE